MYFLFCEISFHIFLPVCLLVISPYLINFQDFLICSFFFFFFLWPYLQQIKVLRSGVKLELQLGPVPQPWQHGIRNTSGNPATAMPDPSHICDLHHSSWQCWILNPVGEAKDQTHILVDTSWVHNPLSYNKNSRGISTSDTELPWLKSRPKKKRNPFLSLPFHLPGDQISGQRLLRVSVAQEAKAEKRGR